METRVNQGVSVEIQSETRNPYKNSSLVVALREDIAQNHPLKIAFLDIDSTLSGDPEVAIQVRELLNQQGWRLVFVTSRTPEMCMSEDEFLASQRLGFSRPAPHLRQENGMMSEAFADWVPDFAGLYNPDVIASITGSNIAVHQVEGGYLTDQRYSKLQTKADQNWRQTTLPVIKQLIHQIDPEGKVTKLSPIDSDENFKAGKTDVAPPETRIQVNFVAPQASEGLGITGNTSGGEDVDKAAAQDAFKYQQDFKAAFENLKQDPIWSKRLTNIRLTDDSNPAKGRFAFYITPFEGNKGRAVQTIIENIVTELGIQPSDIQTLMVGDSFPDIGMSHGAIGTKSTFLLVGDSRLTDVFINPEINNFAGVRLTSLKKRLTPGENLGEYTFNMPLFGQRTVIVGAQAFPKTTGPKTIKAYLETLSS